jgi:hypothetical protein
MEFVKTIHQSIVDTQKKKNAAPVNQISYSRPRFGRHIYLGRRGLAKEIPFSQERFNFSPLDSPIYRLSMNGTSPNGPEPPSGDLLTKKVRKREPLQAERINADSHHCLKPKDK